MATDPLLVPPAPVVDRVLALALPEDEWTHEAHLAVACTELDEELGRLLAGVAQG